MSKICRKFENLSGNCHFSIFRQIFDKFGSPWLEPRKTIVGDKFWTNLGFGAFLNAVRGKRVRKPSGCWRCLMDRCPLSLFNPGFSPSGTFICTPLIRSRPSRPNQRKGQNEKFIWISPIFVEISRLKKGPGNLTMKQIASRHGCVLLLSGVAPANQTKERAKTKSSFFFGEFLCFSLGKQARFTLNFCSGMPLWKVHELTFL